MTENITYYFDDNEEVKSNPDLSDLINEFEQMNTMTNDNYCDKDLEMSEMKNYEMNYTIKQLLLICDYYGLTKQAKTSEYYGAKARTMKKNGIIAFIMMFESNMENMDIVMKRKEMWYYMDLLKADKMMKKYVLW
jgi:hypothetical protein